MKAVFYPLVLISFVAFAIDQFQVSAQISGTATTTSVKALDSNGKRCYMLIANNGTDNINVKLRSAHVADEGVQIPPGGNWEPSNIPVEAIYIKSATGSQAYAISEGVCR